MKKRFLIILLAILTLSISFAVIAFADTEESVAELKIEAASLSFEDSVYVLYAVSHEGIDSSAIQMLFWTEAKESPADYTVGTESFSGSATDITATISEKSCAVFKNDKLRAKNMSDYVYARAYAEVDGVKYYSDVSKYSILQYAYNMLGLTATASDSEAFKNMLESMLQYGADAQIYFNHNTERLADSVFYQINVKDGELEDGFTKGLYTAGEIATLTARETNDGEEFLGWEDQDGAFVSGDNPLVLNEFTKNETYTATYREAAVAGTVKDAALPHYSYEDSEDGIYNTELFYQNSYDIPLGDPTVLPVNENGETWFYVSGTTSGNNFELFKTKNFSNWYYVGVIFTPSENFFGVESFWAPQLLYDPDAERSYYLGEGDGRGVYILYFSARDENGVCKLAVAFSDRVEGPYTTFSGINSNGDYIDETNSCFDVEKLKGLGLYSDHIYGDLYKQNRSFIDSSPYIDPVSGEKYLYMVRNRNVDTSNDVWGVKMKDWVSPDYSTTAPLTANRYTDISKTEEYEYISTNNIDEGPFVYYKDTTDDGVDNGLYYLTFSIGDTNDKLYPVVQAISTSPLGPFTKVQPSEGGIINCPEQHWDIHGSGHHAFFELDGELYIAYHTYKISSGASIASRYFAFDKIEWVDVNGKHLMHSLGPSKAITPLPSAASGYENVALGASATVNGEKTELLTDGLVAKRDGEENMLYSINSDTVITLSFEDYVYARAILIYNSYDYSTAFEKIDRIELSYRKSVDGRYYLGKAFIDDLGFNFEANLIPESYLTAKGESDLLRLRPMGAAIAEFDDIEINEIKIYLSGCGAELATSEITVLGKRCEESGEIIYGEGEIDADFAPYTSFTEKSSVPEAEPDGLSVTPDGKLDEYIWQSLATVTEIQGATIDSETKESVDIELYGERHAKVYSYIGERYIYFAFDVTDKNLFFNSSQPQGRSTAVELYFTSEDVLTLGADCYSVRINPTDNADEHYCNLGVYAGNADGTEWKKIAIFPEIYAAVSVRGSVVTSADGVSNPDNEGYTVEIVIDKALIGLDSDSMRFTAAFVQDRGYDEPRIGNSFIKGTHYTTPTTWIVFTGKE
ncbi:MAG: hypothetical protein IJY18_03335 [Clostridia bacterium]|nr:hypothetical protein [Clostridia bacterium]